MTSYSVNSPGRVNLLGEHVDYNDGIVLPAAIDRSVRIDAVAANDQIVEIHAIDLNEQVRFHLDNLPAKVDISGSPLPGWALYPAGVAWVFQQHGYQPAGLKASFQSNLPIGAGLSSSAAVEVGFGALWQTMGGWQMDRLQLAQFCQQAENLFVGVNCGLMDQFACACGVQDHALQLDTRTLAFQAVPLPPQTAIIIADSSIRRSLAASAYNERRAACETAVELLKPHFPHMRALRDLTPMEFARFAHELPEVVAMRAQHIVEEIARVSEAVECLQRSDADGFGRLMLAGHASLRDLYQVSIPELDILVNIAQALPGCWGSRLTGAGFGGCTVNLVEENRAESFMHELKAAYGLETGKTAEVYLCHASQGVTVEEKA